MAMTYDLISSYIRYVFPPPIKHHKTDGPKPFLPLSVKFVDFSDGDGDDDDGACDLTESL